MMKYQQKLEKEQLILFRFVDIGTELFAMAACLSRAEQLVSEAPSNTSPQMLADLFCSNARIRINHAFNDLKTNNGKKIGQLAEKILEGEIHWLEEGVLNTISKNE